MASIDSRAERIRHFNRFYTERIGVLQEGLLQSRFSLAEARVLYETANSDRAAAAGIAKRLNLDAGYLSRIVKRLLKAGVLNRVPSGRDGRERLLSLTHKGREQFAILDRRSHEEAASILRRLPPGRQEELVRALESAQALLDAPASPAAPIVLRAHRPGDMGWVVKRHGELYFQDEYGWDERFEALVAEIVAGFIARFDAQRERCWIAGREGGTNWAPSSWCVKEREGGQAAALAGGARSARRGIGRPVSGRVSSASRKTKPGIAKWCCGPIAFCTRPAGFTRRRASELIAGK